MHSAVEARVAQIGELCDRYNVARLGLFASPEDKGPDSAAGDFRFVVKFGDASTVGPFDQYMGLLMALERLLYSSVDLLDDSAIENPYLRQMVDERNDLVYAHQAG